MGTFADLMVTQQAASDVERVLSSTSRDLPLFILFRGRLYRIIFTLRIIP